MLKQHAVKISLKQMQQYKKSSMVITSNKDKKGGRCNENYPFASND